MVATGGSIPEADRLICARFIDVSLGARRIPLGSDKQPVNSIAFDFAFLS